MRRQARHCRLACSGSARGTCANASVYRHFSSHQYTIKVLTKSYPVLNTKTSGADDTPLERKRAFRQTHSVATEPHTGKHIALNVQFQMNV